MSRIEHYLLYHDHAPLACLLWCLTAVALAGFRVVAQLSASGVGVSLAILPTAMLVVGLIWILAGASVGWLPRFRGGARLT